jgi:dihydroflavonol-4-reductase
MGRGKVLVTGVTGYIAGHCVRELLAHGYDVRGTVRDLATADAGHLHAFAGRDAGGSLEFAQARLDSDEGWSQAAEGCDYVWHLASPIPMKRPRHEDEFIRPIVDGARRVLTAAAKAGVRRVVYVSSIETIIHNSRTASRARTEEDWSDPAECGAYAKAKLYAERSAWELAAEHELELVTLLPGGVNGPLLRYDRPSSADAVRWMLAGKMPAVPRVSIAVTDVRDLAVAHRLATEIPGAAGNRYICASEPVWLGDIAAILAAEYGPRGYGISTRPLPTWLLRALSPVSDGMWLVSSLAGPKLVSSEKARGELAWVQRPVRETIIDTAEDLIAHGAVAPKRA